jgi:hypothetical protein
MALEWLGNFVKKIDDVLTTPSRQATQIVEQFSEDNPWRTQIGQMTGMVPTDMLQNAANWNQNQQNYDLKADEYKTKLKQQEDRTNAVTSFIGRFNTPEFRATLEKDPNGQQILAYLDTIGQYPTAFDTGNVMGAYTSGNQFAQGITNANKKLAEDTQYIQDQNQNVSSLLSTIPEGPDKQRVAYKFQNAKSREDFDAVWNEAKGLVPKQPTYDEQLKTTNLELKIKETQLQIAKTLKEDPYSSTLKQLQTELEKLKVEKAKRDLEGGGGAGSTKSRLVQNLTSLYGQYSRTERHPVSIQDWIKSQSWSDGQRNYTGTQMLQLFNQEMLADVDTSGIPVPQKTDIQKDVDTAITTYKGVAKAIVAYAKAGLLPGNPLIEKLVARYNDNLAKKGIKTRYTSRQFYRKFIK